MDTVHQHFEDEAREFDQVIQTLIPYYDQMLEALVTALPFAPTEPIVVLDLGCGTGTVAACVLKAFPQAVVTCLDFSARMIELAQVKLSSYANGRYVAQDFRDFAFGDQYDVVVSSLALHHLETDAEKRVFYEKVYRALKPGGCFYNADVVLGSGESLQAAYLDKWKAFMRKRISAEEIERKWLPKYRVEDHPARLLEQLAWLAAIGFSDVDVLWKYYNFAVYGGIKNR
jgi:tRNA (cmo5U34)-methyltransferase